MERLREIIWYLRYYRKGLQMHFRPGRVKVGDVYEDCFYHPVLCTYSDYINDDLEGISLFDGSGPRSCSPAHCGPVKLTPKQVADMIKENNGRISN